MACSASAPLPALTAVASLELKDPALDNALPERWSASTSSGALDAQVGITGERRQGRVSGPSPTRRYPWPGSVRR